VVKFRECIIQKQWKDDLYKYISNIVQSNGHKLLQINGMPDHVHILIGYQPNQALSDLMKAVKQGSSHWINKKRLTRTKFRWQSGYAAFSHSSSQVQKVIQYIKNQESHHKKKTFTEEYTQFLKNWKVDYDKRYLFKPIQK
jgi:REP element-mobilizing transposase RayT